MPAHLAFPVALAANGKLAKVQQDTDADVAKCIDVILSYPLGARQGSPGFGVRTQAFEQGGPHLSEIREAIIANEPRAEDASALLADDRLSGAIARVQVGFGGTS
jgi:hypothetical protein